MSEIEIFISHAHKDQAAAEAFVEFLLDCASIPHGKIRCTAVPGFAHEVGAPTSIQLREDLSACKVVVGLLSKEARDRAFVMMELGAAWVLGKKTFVLLGSKIEPGSMGPLAEIRMVRANQIDKFRLEILGVLTQIAKLVSAPLAPPDRIERAKEVFLERWKSTKFVDAPWYADDEEE
jgi:hypothetical protein